MGRHLDDNVGCWQVDGSVSSLGEEDAIDVIGLLEVLKNIHSFLLRDFTVDEGTHHVLG
jgi:hypothetical protein